MSYLLVILTIDAALASFLITYCGAALVAARRTSRRHELSKAARH